MWPGSYMVQSVPSSISSARRSSLTKLSWPLLPHHISLQFVLVSGWIKKNIFLILNDCIWQKRDEFIRLGEKKNNWKDYLEKTRPEPDSFTSCKGEYLTYSRTINGDNQDLNLTPTESGFERLKWHLPVIWQRNQGWGGWQVVLGALNQQDVTLWWMNIFKRYAFVRMQMEHRDNSRQMR